MDSPVEVKGSANKDINELRLEGKRAEALLKKYSSGNDVEVYIKGVITETKSLPNKPDYGSQYSVVLKVTSVEGESTLDEKVEEHHEEEMGKKEAKLSGRNTRKEKYRASIKSGQKNKE